MKEKILIIGCGGIGSWFIEEICNCIEQEQIDAYTEIAIADNDIAEIEQITFQNFKVEEAGKNKAEMLAKRFKDYGITAIPKRIEQESQLKDYDLIILCVDNYPTRELVFRYCHQNNVEFIDLRAEGRNYFAMPKTTLEENLKFVDNLDKESGSCQRQQDLEKGIIQKGNKVVAYVGVQMLLNWIRGDNNKIQTARI